MFAALCARAYNDPPSGLRVDLQEAQAGGGSLFITLDLATGISPNVSIGWELPSAAVTQIAYSLVLTTPTSAADAHTNKTVLSLSNVSSALPMLFFARTALTAATAYDAVVSVTYTPATAGNSTIVSTWSAPLRFHTGASAAQWAGAAPVWAAKCAGASGAAQPAFAAFSSSIPIELPAASDGVLSAYVYATAAPPIYSDPWNVTKLFAGFKLFVNGSLVGIGPGHTACGPYAMSSCAPVQPVDAYDVTEAARSVVKVDGGGILPLFVTAYGLYQPAVAIAPGFLAVVIIRFSPAGSAPDVRVVTSPGASSAWSALDADGLFSPGANKDSGWYVQPAENYNAACLPEKSGRGGGGGGADCPAPYGSCGWSMPTAAPGAFANYARGGTLPLAGKATQTVHVTPGVPFATSTQLGPGWWLLDPGMELQGGLSFRLAPDAAAPVGVRAVIQLSDELATNGSALWNTRAGMHYRDTWTFPPPGAAHVAQREAQHHEPCEFRYAELILTDAVSGEPLDLAPGIASGGSWDATIWRVHYRYADDGAAAVATSSPDLDAVFALAAATLKTTTMDIYSDSNTRQRSFDCMADNNVAALNHYATTTELALPRMMAAQQMAIGDAGYVSPNWADWTVLPGLGVVADALYTGDLSFAAALYDALLANHTYAWARGVNGLVHVAGLGALVDTSGGNDDGFQNSPFNAVVQAWCYLGMRRVAALGRWLGRAADAAALDTAADGLRTAFRTLMLNGTAGDAVRAVCDGLCSTTPHQAVHSTFYALYAGLLDDDAAATTATAAYVRARASADAVVGIPCGAYPVQFMLAALYADGADHGAAAHAVLTAATRHSWRNMMAVYGATATMECWTPEELPNLSFSHVWSSSPAIIVPQFFFGLAPTAPGFAAYDLRPQPGPVLIGRARLPSVRGQFSVAFTQTAPGTLGGCFMLELTAPGGTVGRVFLPRWGAAVVVTLDGEHVATVDDGDFARVDGITPGAHTLTTCDSALRN